MTEYRVVLITVPNQTEAQKIARGLVENQLAACVNIIGGVESVYHWKGAIECDTELLLICKTDLRQWPVLAEWVKAHHPYEVPEIIQLPILAGSASYLQWIGESVGCTTMVE
jgi:periplasmic divalent cation tolerance protein